MTFIERWTIRICPTCGRERSFIGNCVGTPSKPHTAVNAVDIDVIPATTAEGAVSDLQRIAVACDNGSDATSTMEFIRRVAKPYLHHAGGQSGASPRTDQTTEQR